MCKVLQVGLDIEVQGALGGDHALGVGPRRCTPAIRPHQAAYGQVGGVRAQGTDRLPATARSRAHPLTSQAIENDAAH